VHHERQEQDQDPLDLSQFILYQQRRPLSSDQRNLRALSRELNSQIVPGFCTIRPAHRRYRVGVRAMNGPSSHLLVLSDAVWLSRFSCPLWVVLLTDQGVRAAAADEGWTQRRRLILGRHRSIVCSSCFLACQSCSLPELDQ